MLSSPRTTPSRPRNSVNHFHPAPLHQSFHSNASHNTCSSRSCLHPPRLPSAHGSSWLKGRIYSVVCRCCHGAVHAPAFLPDQFPSSNAIVIVYCFQLIIWDSGYRLQMTEKPTVSTVANRVRIPPTLKKFSHQKCFYTAKLDQANLNRFIVSNKQFSNLINSKPKKRKGYLCDVWPGQLIN